MLDTFTMIFLGSDPWDISQYHKVLSHGYITTRVGTRVAIASFQGFYSYLRAAAIISAGVVGSASEFSNFTPGLPKNYFSEDI